MTDQSKKDFRIALLLAIFTIIYNIVEGIVSLYFGVSDESLTLSGFGIDSLIEVISGIGILQMVIRVIHHGEERRSSFEKRALRVTGTAFYILVAGLIVSAGYNLYIHHEPEATSWGVIIAVVSIVVMLVTLRMKLMVGHSLRSKAIIADAHCTRVCIYMSVVLLVTSAIYEITGVAWIDIVGTLGLAWFSFSEGRECFEKAQTKEL